MVAIACFAACALILASALPRRADLLSPGRVFGFMWCFAIGLADLKFSGLQHAWSAQSWIMMLLGVGAFLSGVAATTVVHLHTPLLTVGRMRQVVPSLPIDTRRLYRWIVGLFIAYAVSYSVAALVKGYIPLLTANPSMMRTRWTVFGVSLFVLTAPVIMFLVLQYWKLAHPGRLRRAALTVILLVTGGSYFLLVQRYDYILWAITSVTFFYYASRYLRARSVLLVLAAVLLLFYGIQSIRFVGFIQNLLYLISKMKFPVQYAFLTEPYMYVVMNLENFARGVDRLDHNTFGFFTFNFVMSLTGLKHWLAEYFAIEAIPYTISGYNTFSYLWPLYRDFGAAGVAGGSLGLGLAAGALYHRMRAAPTMLSVSLYSITVFALVMSFFHLAPSLLYFAFDMTILAVVHWTCAPGRARVLPVPPPATGAGRR